MELVDMVALRTKQVKRLTYTEAGVDIDAGDDFVSSIAPAAISTAGADRPGAMNGFGKGYGALFDLKAAGYTDPVLVSSTDGVGTKLRIAIETGILNTVGIDLVAMCVNDILCRGGEPLFFLDYFACGKIDKKLSPQIIEGIAAGCKIAGVALIGGETAEMPDFYSGRDFDLAGFSVGAVERERTLPRLDQIATGDVLIGLASSGVHSNGFSFVRRVVSGAALSWDEPAPFAPDKRLGESLLTPTQIYVKSVLPLLRGSRHIKALAHITGSAHAGKLQRILPETVTAHINLQSWVVPPVFKWLRDEAGLTSESDERNEFLRTFNCGIGMVAIVDRNAVDEVLRHLKKAGQEVFVIGQIEPHREKPVKFSGRLRFAS